MVHQELGDPGDLFVEFPIGPRLRRLALRRPASLHCSQHRRRSPIARHNRRIRRLALRRSASLHCSQHKRRSPIARHNRRIRRLALRRSASLHCSQHRRRSPIARHKRRIHDTIRSLEDQEGAVTALGDGANPGLRQGCCAGPVGHVSFRPRRRQLHRRRRRRRRPRSRHHREDRGERGRPARA